MSSPTALAAPGGVPSSRAKWSHGTLVIHVVLIPAALAGAAWFVERGGTDLRVATAWFDPQAHDFPLRSSFWFDVLGHQAARAIPVLVCGVALVVGLVGRHVDPWKSRASLVFRTGLCCILGPLVIDVLKHFTTLPCPAALHEFGGFVSYVAQHAGPFWTAHPENAGRCSPSGHAGGGFSLLSLYFFGWSLGRPRWRAIGLVIGIVTGVVFSTVRIAQGSHFLSATIWSASIDWLVCALLFLPLLARGSAPAAARPSAS